jgi:aromatic-L-amino-acid decarboxylase
MAGLLGLPDRFRSTDTGGGVIQDSASSAALVAIVTARDRAQRQGHDPGQMVVYVSTQAHSSLEKGARVAAVGHLRQVEVDGDLAMRPDALSAAIEADGAAGLVPIFVNATVGTTSSHAVDPVGAIAAVAALHGLWVHVDAAHLGMAALCPEHRSLLAGVEAVDSVNTNAHKWLFTNFDCSLMWFADRRPLLAALSILPEYLRNEASATGHVIDYRDWQIPLGRRFRALKLWFVLCHYGAEGLRHHIREHIRLTAQLAERFDADPRFEVVAPVRASLLCVAHVDGDDATNRLLGELNASGRTFLSHTVLDGRYVIRISIGSTLTEERHVDDLWTLFDTSA